MDILSLCEQIGSITWGQSVICQINCWLHWFDTPGSRHLLLSALSCDGGNVLVSSASAPSGVSPHRQWKRGNAHLRAELSQCTPYSMKHFFRKTIPDETYYRWFQIHFPLRPITVPSSFEHRVHTKPSLVDAWSWFSCLLLIQSELD